MNAVHAMSHAVPKVKSFAAAAMAHTENLQPQSDSGTAIELGPQEAASGTAPPNDTGDCMQTMHY